jgi:hypothetical protein
VTAALSLAGELMGNGSAPASETVDKLTERLTQCVDRDESGRPQLRISLENDESLRSLATTLAKLLG